jgi:hypothetical protein
MVMEPQEITDENIREIARLTKVHLCPNCRAIFSRNEFSASCSGGLERDQQSAMEGSPSRVDELCNFFLAADGWRAKYPFRIGSIGDAPGPLECLDVGEP